MASMAYIWREDFFGVLGGRTFIVFCFILLLLFFLEGGGGGEGGN